MSADSITVGMLQRWRETADECFAALERGEKVAPAVSGALAQAVLMMTNEALVELAESRPTPTREGE